MEKVIRLMIVMSVVCLLGVQLWAGESLTKVSYYPAWINHWENAGVLVAISDQTKFYQDAELKVSDYAGGPALNPIERMLNDHDISFATSYSWLVLMARINQGLDNLIVIATDFQSPALYLVTWFPIKEKKDLFGRTIEVWQGYEYPLLAYLGEDKQKVNICYQGASMEPFLLKQVDGAHAMIYNELLTVLHEYGFNNLEEYYAAEKKPFYVYSFGELDPEIAWEENSLITTKDTLYKYPEIVQRFVSATYQGWRWVMTHDAEKIVDIMLVFNNSLDRSHEIASGIEINKLMVNENTELYGLGYINPDSWISMANKLFEAGVLDKMPTVAELMDIYSPIPSGVFPAKK